MNSTLDGAPEPSRALAHTAGTTPAVLDADTAERLASIEAAADVIVDHIVPPNTRRAFAADWKVWSEFCAIERMPTDTVSAGLLVAFATWCAHPHDDRPAAAPATITRRLAGILDGWKRTGADIPHGITRDARRVIAAYAKHLRRAGEPTGRGSSPALTIPELRAISATCGSDLRGLRDRAILVLGFSMAARRSTLAALNFVDVVQEDDGLLVEIRDDKTGARTVAVPYGSDPLTCPVRAWRAWTFAADIVDGRAFRSIRKGGTVGTSMTGDAVNDVIQTRAREAGIAKRLTAHSMRSGLATESRRAGKDARIIAEQGGWKPNSMVLFGYMQIVDRWEDNAAQGIGL